MSRLREACIDVYRLMLSLSFNFWFFNHILRVLLKLFISLPLNWGTNQSVQNTVCKAVSCLHYIQSIMWLFLFILEEFDWVGGPHLKQIKWQKLFYFNRYLKQTTNKLFNLIVYWMPNLPNFSYYWYWDIKCVNKRMKSSKSMETVCDDNDMRSIDR